MPWSRFHAGDRVRLDDVDSVVVQEVGNGDSVIVMLDAGLVERVDASRLQLDFGGTPRGPSRERSILREREGNAGSYARNLAKAHRHACGERVSADYGALGYFHEAVVTATNADGSYAVLYDDGLREDGVPPNRIAPPGGPAPEPRGGAPRQGRRAASPPRGRPPSRQLPPAPAAASGYLGVGSRVSANWQMLGYWHPATVLALLDGGAYQLQCVPRNSSAQLLAAQLFGAIRLTLNPSAGTTTATRSARRRRR